MGIVVDYKDISRIAEAHRNIEKRTSIVTTNGCYDLLHSGHLYSLEEAKKRGNVLMVGVNSDNYIKFHKGLNRPILPEEERVKMVGALECVNYAFIFGHNTPNQFLEQIKPDIHVKSRSGYKGYEGPVLQKWGGKVELIEDIPGTSTSDLLKKIWNQKT